MNKQIKKAVIPAAGLGTRFLPATKAMPKEMLPIVDIPTIQYIIEEAVKSGIEEIIVITNANKSAIENHFDKSYELEDRLKESNKDELLAMVQKISNMVNVHYVRQKEPKGLGHAILHAKAFVGDEPFAVLLGDDVVVNDDKPALKQLIDAYNQKHASIVGVQEVSEEDVSKYGIVSPASTNHSERLIKLQGMVEKPNKDVAPSHLAVLGRYILTPQIFDILENQEAGVGGEIQLTDAICKLMDMQTVYAYDFEGIRYDVGDKFGFVKATIDFALRTEGIKEEVASYIKELSSEL